MLTIRQDTSSYSHYLNIPEDPVCLISGCRELTTLISSLDFCTEAFTSKIVVSSL